MPGEIVHVALGGTISMRIIDGLAQPVLHAAELARLAGIETTPVDLATLGGPQLDFELLSQLATELRRAERAAAAGVIVTLGTDAIEEVSAFIAYTGPWTVGVVVTGSMEPGGEPNSDGPANLRDAVALLTQATLQEPVVAFAGGVSLARAVMKVRGLDLDAFASPTARTWTLQEVLDAGQLPDLPPIPSALGPPGPGRVDVPIILSVLGLGPVPADPPDEHPAALICVASGAGNLAPDAAAHALTALAHGSVVAISTRALDRQLSAGYGYPGGSGELARAGAVLATGMSPHRLRIFLLIGLSQGLASAALKAALQSHVDSLMPPAPA